MFVIVSKLTRSRILLLPLSDYLGILGFSNICRLGPDRFCVPILRRQVELIPALPAKREDPIFWHFLALKHWPSILYCGSISGIFWHFLAHLLLPLSDYLGILGFSNVCRLGPDRFCGTEISLYMDSRASQLAHYYEHVLVQTRKNKLETKLKTKDGS